MILSSEENEAILDTSERKDVLVSRIVFKLKNTITKMTVFAIYYCVSIV